MTNPIFMKPDLSGPADIEGVLAVAARVVQEHGEVGIQRFVDEGRLSEVFPFRVEFPLYDASKVFQAEEDLDLASPIGPEDS